MPPPAVVLIRHAQSEHHVCGLTGGWTDTPLTTLGREQATLLADRLREELTGISVRVITSDLLRAAQTARIVARALGTGAEPDPRLREFNNGEAANLTVEEFEARFSGVLGRPWGADERPFPGSESNRLFASRTAAVLASLSDDGPLPLLVTHGGTIPMLVAAWLGLGVEAMAAMSFASDTTSITTLYIDGNGVPGIERLNDTGHLAGIDGRPPLRRLVG